MGPTANERGSGRNIHSLYSWIRFCEVTCSQYGLKKNPRHAAFNRLAMYNNTDLRSVLTKHWRRRTFSLLNVIRRIILIWTICIRTSAGRFEEIWWSCPANMKAVELDPPNELCIKTFPSAYEQKNDYKKRSGAITGNITRLSIRKTGSDLQFQLGRLYYGCR